MIKPKTSIQGALVKRTTGRQHQCFRTEGNILGLKALCDTVKKTFNYIVITLQVVHNKEIWGKRRDI